MMIIYLISSLANSDFGINIYSVIYMIFGVLFGIVGGIIGANKKWIFFWKIVDIFLHLI